MVFAIRVRILREREQKMPLQPARTIKANPQNTEPTKTPRHQAAIESPGLVVLKWLVVGDLVVCIDIA